MDGLKTGAMVLIIAALLIPVLSGLTQWISIKLTSTSIINTEADNPMAISDEDDECYDANVICIYVFHIPGRSWYLLDCQRDCPMRAAVTC